MIMLMKIFKQIYEWTEKEGLSFINIPQSREYIGIISIR